MRVYFRTEGNHEQGMGDVWCSIALAHTFKQRDAEVLIAISGGEEAIRAIREQGFDPRIVTSKASESDVLTEFRPDVGVVIQLDSDPEYVQNLKNVVTCVVTVDDSGDAAKFSDLRINVLYETPDSITDPGYIILRDEFQTYHGRKKLVRDDVSEVLVTQGGADTHGFTPSIIDSLNGCLPTAHHTIVLGPEFSHDDELSEILDRGAIDATVLRNASNMADLMWEADLAITAGGITMFELASVGTPAIVVCGESFENETASRLDALGIVKNLGFSFALDGKRLHSEVATLAADRGARVQMSEVGRAAIDGKGCRRIVERILEELDRATSR